MVDRVIVYPGAIPLEVDILNTNRNAMVGLSKLSAAVFGTSTIVNGLAVVPTGPPSLQVLVNPGEIYSLQNLENSAYSSLTADTAHQIVKQGVSLDAVTLNCPAPGTAGQSITYLIQASYTDADGTPVALPYYNASNPSVAWSGPNNLGTQQNTVRKGAIQLVAKAGVAAATGTQSTPAPDIGYVGLYIVSVANGQTTITLGNILAIAGAPTLGAPVTNGRLIGVQRFTTSGTYTPTPGTNSIVVEVQGGGGGGGGSSSTGASQLSGGAGGNSGAYGKSRLTSAFSGTVVTVGAGGAGGVAVSGSAGGTSSFGAFVTAPGGAGGSYLAASTPPIIGGPVPNTAIASGGNLINALSGSGTVSYLISGAAAQGGSGGNTIFGNGPAGVASTGNGNGGYVIFGCGGAGALTSPSTTGNFAGGYGSTGVVLIWEYA